MSKVIRLLGAEAQLGAEAGLHQAADHVPGGPRLQAVAAPVGRRAQTGNRRWFRHESGAALPAGQLHTQQHQAGSLESIFYGPVLPAARVTPVAKPDSPLSTGLPDSRDL